MFRTLLFSFIVVLTACGAEKQMAQVTIPSSAEKATLTVSNMTCSTCGPTVRRALLKVPGVYKASVDVGAHKATVYYYPQQADVARLTQATTNAGYPSKELQ